MPWQEYWIRRRGRGSGNTAIISLDDPRFKNRSRPLKPTIGRIVHYTNLGDADGRYPPEAHPAIITGVHETNPPGTSGPLVDLHIFYRTGQFDMERVPFSPVPMERGHWNWPAIEK